MSSPLEKVNIWNIRFFKNSGFVGIVKGLRQVAHLRKGTFHAEGQKALRNHLYWSSESLAEGFGGEVSPQVLDHSRAESGNQIIFWEKRGKNVNPRGLPFSEPAVLPKRKLQKRIQEKRGLQFFSPKS